MNVYFTIELKKKMSTPGFETVNNTAGRHNSHIDIGRLCELSPL